MNSTTTPARLWIANPLAIQTNSPEDARGGLVIQSGTIVEVVAAGQQPERYDQLFDASRHVLIPGLINTHHHFYQTLTRALPAALNKELFPWLQTLYPVWAGLQPDMLHQATRLALTELLLSGCTTAADHHYLFPQTLTDAIDVQADAAADVGLRVTLTRGSMSLGQDDGGLPPQSVVQSEATILADSERLIRRYHDAAPGSMMQVALAPCSPFSVTRDIMIASAELAARHQVRLHTHLAETLDEEAFCQKMFGLRTVDYLESVNWLHNRTWLAHGIHFDANEIQRLGTAGVGICHCPTSNMMLASGICPVQDLEAAGSPVGIGVDGSASNDCSNMIQETRQAMYLQRLKYGSSKVTHQDALRWATQGSANVLGRDDIGTLAVGKQADLALFGLDELRFSGSHDPLAALLLCGAHQADYVMVAGQWKVEKGEVAGVDIDELRHSHQQAANALAALA
ncbi:MULTISPECIES: 8-oxoguanine deaminase [unclassified Oceanobacter]|uniref:8-oxoguanine deaminase n=1 Tax=unclassified Oceanobacter TaxID=2620260 RepID=UPI002736DF74|nr:MULTISPECIES: 8-oxoguanine deaminase [unclassified Oceanobacter]MDP2608379.1 8-oxoguanine deaminase [Oceanobacter sp. 1_MG-2023]MDP2611474.1 8-oxoguanine deaminase [Oceanobacter sp. 2_MG-2023]